MRSTVSAVFFLAMFPLGLLATELLASGHRASNVQDSAVSEGQQGRQSTGLSPRDTANDSPVPVILEDPVPTVLRDVTTASSRVPRVLGAEMAESSRARKVLGAAMAGSSRGPRVLRAEITESSQSLLQRGGRHRDGGGHRHRDDDHSPDGESLIPLVPAPTPDLWPTPADPLPMSDPWPTPEVPSPATGPSPKPLLCPPSGRWPPKVVPLLIPESPSCTPEPPSPTPPVPSPTPPAPSPTPPVPSPTPPAPSPTPPVQAPIPPAPSPTPEPPPPTPTETPTDMAILLELHNEARCIHNADPLTYSDNVATSAMAHAQVLSSSSCGDLYHSESDDRNGYGENIFLCWTTATTSCYTPEAAMASLYESEIQVDTVAEYGGHATQILWKSTTELGCAVTTCDLGLYHYAYLVCQYNPPGNYLDDLEQEVELPSGTSC